MEYTKGESKMRRGQYPHRNTKDFIAIVGDKRVAAIIGEKWDDAEANAQLISASPDLYEACKLALKLSDAIVKQVSGDNVEVLMASMLNFIAACEYRRAGYINFCRGGFIECRLSSWITTSLSESAVLTL